MERNLADEALARQRIATRGFCLDIHNELVIGYFRMTDGWYGVGP